MSGYMSWPILFMAIIGFDERYKCVSATKLVDFFTFLKIWIHGKTTLVAQRITRFDGRCAPLVGHHLAHFFLEKAIRGLWRCLPSNTCGVSAFR